MWDRWIHSEQVPILTLVIVAPCPHGFKAEWIWRSYGEKTTVDLKCLHRQEYDK